MMTSGQIAGMMGQQNQMFAGAAAYSQQISQQMPGAYGAGIGQSSAFAQVPGGMQQQGGFSYGGPQGQNIGSRMGGSIVSGMGGAAQFGMGAVGVAAGFGMMGKMGAPFDPFMGGGAGWRAGGAAGRAMGMGRMGTGMMRLGMGAAGMLPAAGVMMGGAHVIGSMMAGAQEQSAVQNVLGRQKMGGAPVGGQSFSSSQASGISDMMRGMQALPEMMTSMSELTRIMDKMGQMGAMAGASNVKEFKDKFKQNIKLLKDMSKVMSTSMEEALPMFGEIKRSGFYSTGDILKNAMNRQLTGGISGMGQGQVSQVAQYGAQVNWQRGGTLKAGAQHGLRTAQQLGAAKSLGLLTEEQISEATGGVGGAEGLKMMSQRMTGMAHKMAQGSIGLAMTVALGEKDKSGRFTGGMDEDLMERYNAGEFSFKDIKRMANKRKQGRQAIQSWATHKKSMRASLASGMGVEGTTRMLQDALGGRGFDSPDHMRLMAQRFGMSERDTNTYLPLMQRMPELMQEMKQQGRARAKNLARESFMKENYSWGAVKAKAKKRIEGVITEPFKEMGASISDAINGAVDDFVDDVTGRYKVRVSKEMATLVQGAMSGVSGDQSRLTRMFDQSKGVMGKGGFGGMLGGGADLTPGMGGDIMNWMSGTQTAGERMVGNLGMVGGGRYLTRFSGEDEEARAQRRGGVNILSRDHKYWGRDDAFAGSTNEQLMGARADLLSLAGGGDTALSRKAGGAMGMPMMWGEEGETIGDRAQKDMAKMLTNNMSLANLSGGERLRKMTELMGESTAFQMLKAGVGKGAEADIFGALEAASGGKLGSGLSGIFGKMGTGMSSFRDVAGVSKMREETDEKIRKLLGGDVGEDFLAMREASIGDKSMDLIFGGVLGDTSDLMKRSGQYRGRKQSREELLSKHGRFAGYKGHQEAQVGEGEELIMGEGGKQYVMKKGDLARREVMERAVAGLEGEDREIMGQFGGGMKDLLVKYAAEEVSGTPRKHFSKGIRSLIALQGKSYKTLVGQQHAQSILRKFAEKGELTDGEKAFLRDQKIDVSGLQGKEGQKKARKMLELMGKLEEKGLKDPEVMALLAKSRDLSVMGSLAGIAAQFKESGDTLGGAIKSLQQSGVEVGADFEKAHALMVSSEEEDFRQAAGQNTDKDGNPILDPDTGKKRLSAAELIGRGAIGLLGKEEGARIAKGLGGDVQAAYTRATTLKGRYKGDKTTIGQLLPGFDTMSAKQKEQIFGMTVGEGETRNIQARVSESEFEKVLQYGASGAAGKGIVSPEEREASKFANPAEIARAMSSFAQSTTTLAGIVSTMQPEGGKKDAGKGIEP